jgi:hypothetical protein
MTGSATKQSIAPQAARKDESKKRARHNRARWLF